jgi:hypothetical protein
MQEVRAALLIPGQRTMPRRVVVDETRGILADKYDHPHGKEIVSLSCACEAVRRALGEPIYHRDTSQLMHTCMNEPTNVHAWAAMYRDVQTGDFNDLGAARTWTVQGSVQAIVRAATAHQLTHVMAIWAKVLGAKLIDMDAQAKGVVDVFQEMFTHVVSIAETVAADVREAFSNALGKLFGVLSPPPDTCAAALVVLLMDRRTEIDEFLKVFAYLDVRAMLQRRPEILELLFQRVRSTIDRTTYSIVCITHRIVDAETNDDSISEETRVICGAIAGKILSVLVHQQRTETIDFRIVLGTSSILSKINPPTLASTVATALKHVCIHAINTK